MRSPDCCSIHGWRARCGLTCTRPRVRISTRACAPGASTGINYGFGLWLLRDRHTGEMVGRGGLQYTYVAEVHAVEAGWAIVPERWGDGLATELANTCVEVGFGDLDLTQIVAFALPDNIASRRVMEKAGFVFDRPIIHVGLPHVLYRRDRNPRRERPGRDSDA